MSGSAVVRYLLANAGAVTAVVPATRILDDDPPPANAVLPLIIVDQISGTPYNFIEPNQLPKMHTDRVQVSAKFKGQYGTPAGAGKAGCVALLKLVLAACPNQRGTINGVVVDSIVPDLESAAIHDYEGDIWFKSRDFFVRWLQTA